jgi:hypothetical protein
MASCSSVERLTHRLVGGRRRREEVLRRRISVLLSMALMLAVIGASPAFADPDKNDPPAHSCGLNDPNVYLEDETEPGAKELTLEGNKPLEFGCAPGKDEDPRPQ